MEWLQTIEGKTKFSAIMRSASHRGFTLSELLVVVAILILLVGLTVPALSLARQQFNELRCTNNMRQLGQLFEIYANEHDGLMPSSQGNTLSYTTATGSWTLALMDYMKIPYPTLNQNSIFLCPQARYTYPKGQALRTYAMNAAGGTAYTPARVINYPHASQVAFLIDSTSNGSTDGWAVVGSSDYNKVADWRHQEGINILFMDGHVIRLPKNSGDALGDYIRNYIR